MASAWQPAHGGGSQPPTSQTFLQQRAYKEQVRIHGRLQSSRAKTFTYTHLALGQWITIQSIDRRAFKQGIYFTYSSIFCVSIIWFVQPIKREKERNRDFSDQCRVCLQWSWVDGSYSVGLWIYLANNSRRIVRELERRKKKKKKKTLELFVIHWRIRPCQRPKWRLLSIDRVAVGP